MDVLIRSAGLDPGNTGGLAISTWSFSGKKNLEDSFKLRGLKVYPFAKFENPAKELFYLLENTGGEVRIPNVLTLEKVWSSPQMGVRSAFSFGENYGLCKAVLQLTKDSFVETHNPTPQKWQSDLGILSKGRTHGVGSTTKKNRNKDFAQGLFPSQKMTHAIADACLLSYWGLIRGILPDYETKFPTTMSLSQKRR